MQIKNIIEKHERNPANLIHILLDYQSSKDNNCITEEEVAVIADELGITKSRIYSIVTFYTLFSVKPRGKFIIQVCDDIPCYVNGSVNIIMELEKLLGIKMGETTPDGMFTLEKTSCIGCCDKPPAFRVGEELYGDLDSRKISGVITELRRRYNEHRE